MSRQAKLGKFICRAHFSKKTIQRAHYDIIKINKKIHLIGIRIESKEKKDKRLKSKILLEHSEAGHDKFLFNLYFKELRT